MTAHASPPTATARPAPAEAPSTTASAAPAADQADHANHADRLVHLFRDSRAAGEVHPLEHLLLRHLNGERA